MSLLTWDPILAQASLDGGIGLQSHVVLDFGGTSVSDQLTTMKLLA